MFDKLGVTGSNPVSPTTRPPLPPRPLKDTSPTVSRVAPDRTGSSTPHRLCPLGLERLVPNHTLAAVAGADAKGVGLGINHPGLVVEGDAFDRQLPIPRALPKHETADHGPELEWVVRVAGDITLPAEEQTVNQV